MHFGGQKKGSNIVLLYQSSNSSKFPLNLYLKEQNIQHNRYNLCITKLETTIKNMEIIKNKEIENLKKINSEIHGKNIIIEENLKKNISNNVAQTTRIIYGGIFLFKFYF